ncbi:MAG: ATP-binding protein [Candidatus Omnitrophica bacterium]|nr:ATP-binding protein [Candidatus Omnitrophota bacterium]MDD5353287.1 ATP-binding protein [Candidatus Omnitrophota bacterium]
MTFRKAERKKAKLRLGIVGPSGSGKTFSALLMAKGLGGKIAVVDTENGSADLYAGSPGIPEYDVLTMEQPYEVEKYLAAIEAAEKEGYNVIILDSISHAWSGEGGLLDRQGKIADSGKGNSYTAWRTVTPLHNRFVERMLNCNLHLIATMRAKTDYAMSPGANGKVEVKKIGLAPVQRDGMDYEFTSVFDIDINHNVQSSKDRTGMFDGKIFTPTTKTGEQLIAWLETGVEPEPIKQEEKKDSKKETTADTTPIEYVTPAMKKAVEAIIEKNKFDRDTIKEFFLRRGQIGIKEDGSPTLDKLYKSIAGKMIGNEGAFVAAFNKFKESREAA